MSATSKRERPICTADYTRYGVECGKPSVTRRRVWRFGGASEKPIVKEWFYLCADDAQIYDDIQSEGRAEAAGS